MADTTDLRSEGDECEDTENDFRTAMDCPIARETVHTIIKQYICVPDGVEIGAVTGHHTLDADVITAGFHTDHSNLLETMYNKYIAQDDLVIVITSTNTVDPTTLAATPQAAFLFAVAMVLLFHVSGKCLTVVMPSAQMGIPGTSLTLRHALRCFMDETHYTVTNLLKDMQGVCDSVASVV